MGRLSQKASTLFLIFFSLVSTAQTLPAPLKALPENKGQLIMDICNILALASCPYLNHQYREVDPLLAKYRAGDFRSLSAKVYSSDIAINAIGAIYNGAQIVLEDGEWVDAKIVIRQSGSANAPIIVRPKTPGMVTFKGNSRLEVSGKYIIVSGFKFEGGTLSTTDKNHSAVIKIGNLRDGTTINYPCDNCILTDVSIDNVGIASENGITYERDYVFAYGRDITIAHSTFTNFKGEGYMIEVPQRSEVERVTADGRILTTPQRTHIYKNVFRNKEYISGKRGCEVIQIGSGGPAVFENNQPKYFNYAAPSFSIVEDNIIQYSEGFPAVITLKASDVLLLNNTLSQNNYPIVLRAANRIIIAGNRLNGLRGDGDQFVSSIYITGDANLIYNNHFKGNGTPKDKNKYPLSIMNAQITWLKGNGTYLDYNQRGLPQTRNLRVVNNFFENNKSTVNYGASASVYPLSPVGVKFWGNKFSTPEPDPVFVAPSPSSFPSDLITDLNTRNIWDTNILNRGFTGP